jgi:hypothetical protein
MVLVRVLHLLRKLLFVEREHSPNCAVVILVSTTRSFTCGNRYLWNFQIVRLEWVGTWSNIRHQLIVTGTCFLMWVVKLGGRIFSAGWFSPDIRIFRTDGIETLDCSLKIRPFDAQNVSTIRMLLIGGHRDSYHLLLFIHKLPTKIWWYIQRGKPSWTSLGHDSSLVGDYLVASTTEFW